jgi:pyruvate,orthophosphate dikinase
MTEYIYFFGDGKADGSAAMKDLLGGKGAGLAEMTNIGVPVPPGFTISTEACTWYSNHAETFPPELAAQLETGMTRLEATTGKKFGDIERPLLVSVRSGARASMPGMMDTILNLGLNDEAVEGLARSAGERFAFDSYRRFITMYSDVVLGVDHEFFEHLLDAAKGEHGAKIDADLSAAALRELVSKYMALVAERTGSEFPQDVGVQLDGAIRAVFASWNNQRAITYRRLNGIPDEWGTAVNVQAMVFGNMGDDCATGVAFTRNPSTGEKRFYGEFLPNAQGEDVVAGIRTPHPISKDKSHDQGHSLEEMMPDVYAQLVEVYRKLEDHYRDMQDIEFTIESGRLYMLQTRTGKRTGFAAAKIACDMVDEGMIDKTEAVRRVDATSIIQLLAPLFDPEAKRQALTQERLLATGLPAGPGAATGRVAFTAERAVDMARGEDPVILVRLETSPEDISGMHAAAGILTSRGGLTSHAAVVARGMGKPCVVGCGAVRIDYARGELRVDEHTPLQEGDWLSIDGTTGEVIFGRLDTKSSEVIQVLIEESMKPEDSDIYSEFDRIVTWADEIRSMKVRTNADTPYDTRMAIRFGAEGVGLCRTEHMFFAEDRILAVREMILARDREGRRAALKKILPFQRDDFNSMFRELGGLPITIRLLDPPLHEFLPQNEVQISTLARDMNWGFVELRSKVQQLEESNPMLGHRGCRLGITYPEIYEMQAQAIFEAACDVAREGIAVLPEVMIPLIGTTRELEITREMVERIAKKVFEAKGCEVPVVVGTMIEIPRAALTAGDIADKAAFFSFGTNDLTQMTFGYSRDDVGAFLPTYLQERVVAKDPFESIDVEGVGQLVRIAVENGRKANPKLKLGICGEHGGDPDSIRFFRQVGLDYVSCSPFRVPIARLAAAQAELEQREKDA